MTFWLSVEKTYCFRSVLLELFDFRSKGPIVFVFFLFLISAGFMSAIFFEIGKKYWHNYAIVLKQLVMAHACKILDSGSSTSGSQKENTRTWIKRNILLRFWVIAFKFSNKIWMSFRDIFFYHISHGNKINTHKKSFYLTQNTEIQIYNLYKISFHSGL